MAGVGRNQLCSLEAGRVQAVLRGPGWTFRQGTASAPPAVWPAPLVGTTFAGPRSGLTAQSLLCAAEIRAGT